MQNLDPANPPPALRAGSDNPTVAAANESTGVEPLNAGPTKPQQPQHEPIDDQIPSALSSLPDGCEAVVFPFALLESKKESRNETQPNSISSLPSASQFENLVKVRSSGPQERRTLDLIGGKM